MVTDSDMLCLSLVLLICLPPVTPLNVPYNVQARQIWPGEVQVTWSLDVLHNTISRIYYKALGREETAAWEWKTVEQASVALLEGLRANTNYTVQVTSEQHGMRHTSQAVYVYVRDGVPRAPYNLTYMYDTKFGSNDSILLTWLTDDASNTDSYLVQLQKANHTLTAQTLHPRLGFQNVGSLSGFTVKVFAINKAGKSRPALLEYRSPMERRHDSQPSVSNVSIPETATPSNIVSILGGTILVVLLISIVLFLRRRNLSEHASQTEDVTTYEPFLSARPRDSDISMTTYHQRYLHQVDDDDVMTSSGSPYRGCNSLIHPGPSRPNDLSPLRQVRYMQHSPAMGRNRSPDKVNSYSADEADPYQRSKRYPIIPIEGTDDRLYSNVDVTKYQLKLPRPSSNSVENLTESSLDGSSIYARIS